MSDKLSSLEKKAHDAEEAARVADLEEAKALSNYQNAKQWAIIRRDMAKTHRADAMWAEDEAAAPPEGG